MRFSLLQQAHQGIIKTLYSQEQWQVVLEEVQKLPKTSCCLRFLIAGGCALNLKNFFAGDGIVSGNRDRYPSHPMAKDVPYYAGTAAYKLERFDQARRYFSDFIQQYPDHEFVSLAQFYIGWTYFREDQYEKAIHEFHVLIENFPDSDQVMLAQLKIADSYFNMGLYDEALEEYQRVIQDTRIMPTSERPYMASLWCIK